MRKLKILIISACLAGCTIPTPLDHMTPQQISALPDQEICHWADLGDTIAIPEAIRRNVNCDPSYQYCIGLQIKPGTALFLDCVKEYYAYELRAGEAALNYDIQQKRIQMEAIQNAYPKSRSQKTSCHETLWGLDCTTKEN